MTHLEQFASDLHQDVLVKSGQESDPKMREDAFTELVLEILNEHNDANGAEVFYNVKGGRGRMPAAKANAWALSGDGATLDLFVTLYHGNGGTDSVPKSVVADHYKLLRGFLRRAREGYHQQMEEVDPAFHPAQQIFEAKDTLTSVRLFFLTDGVVRSSGIDQETVPGLDIQYVLWDLEKLSRLRVGGREVIQLDFVNEYEGSIPCLQMADVTGEYRTFLAFLRAPLLAQIYGKYSQRLLERNVRAFLQAKGKINKGLQLTLRDEPNRFLAYNNGLCCTAAEVRLEKTEGGHTKLAWVKDFQIVNGGQTTASIFHALKKDQIDISQVVVQLKLTVLNDPQKVTEIVPLISKYANSQNKVNGADFSANGKFHHQLEQLSRTVYALPTSGMERGTHWYYERARGSYLDDKAKEGTKAKIKAWEENNPVDQKFTKTDLAKYEHAWLGLPHLVCKGAEKNFIAFAERQEDEGEPKVDLNYFKHTIAKVILFRTAERLYKDLNLEGYRANTIAYALAWMAKHSQHRIDLNWIWENQRVAPFTEDVIKTVCRAAYSHLTATSGNVGEWSKRVECWEAFRQKEIEIGVPWEREWAETGFISLSTEFDALAEQWERVRHLFVDDSRTLGELEKLTGLEWLSSRRADEARIHAVKSFRELKGQGGRRYRNVQNFISLYATAAQIQVQA